MIEPPHEPVALQRKSGSMLGSYQLVLRVAIGGMGEIWAARMRRGAHFDRIVALKTILPELSYQPSFETMFLDEARLAGRIDHPNVVKVLDVGEHDEVLYQVMEWVPGTTLWALLRAAKGAPMPLEVAGRILYQTCAGLHAAHELTDEGGQPIGLVHRDVSPQNVLLTEEGLVKIVDFGVAKYAGRGVAETQKGELRGKVPYMAPEHILGQPLDRRADVFALGTLLYQMASGHHPYLKSEDLLTLAAISGPEVASPLAEILPSIPQALSDVVVRAMDKNPELRTPSALTLMKEIAKEIPQASQLSANARVEAYIRDVLGDKKDVRATRISAALKRLDGRASDSAPAPLDLTGDDDPTIREPTPADMEETRRWRTHDPVEVPLRKRSPGKTFGLAVGGLAAVAFVGAILVSTSSGGGGGDRAGAGETSAPPGGRDVVSASVDMPAASAPPPAPDVPETAEPVASVAPTSEPTAAPSAAVSAKPHAPPPNLIRPAPPPPPPPGEFLPDGL